jgi:sec-independent protein translocase protein TatC
MGEAGQLRQRRLRFLRLRRRRERAASMTMLEHLDELRRRLIIAALAFMAVSVVAFIFFDPVTDFLLRPLCELPREKLGTNGCKLVFTSPIEPFTVRLKVTALTGMVAASPVWLYQLWAFIVPGLTPRERKLALPFVISSVGLFAAGVSFAYATLPTAFRVLIGFGGENLQSFFTANEYLNFVGLVIIVFGVTFELPLLLFFLGLVGIVTVEQLQRFRRGAIVSIALLAAVVTPSQDPYTMLVMAVPLYAFYEAVILGLRIVKRRRARRA